METREHPYREAWNKGKLVGQKAPLKPKDIWAIRIHLQNAHEVRDLAMFAGVRQLRSQVLVFYIAYFQKCHYNSANCSGAAGFSIPNA